jgi:hypothetical protein
VRDSIPVESILQAYMDQTVEEDVVEEVKEQIIEQPTKKEEETQIIKESNQTFIKTCVEGSSKDISNLIKDEFINMFVYSSDSFYTFNYDIACIFKFHYFIIIF